MRLAIFFVLFAINSVVYSQKPVNTWRAAIVREDGMEIPFNFTIQQQKNTSVTTIINANERLKVDSIKFTTDSIFIKMPVFESAFKGAISTKNWEGIWIKGTAKNEQVLPFKAQPGINRFTPVEGNAKYNITGRWAVSFGSEQAQTSIAEFVQKGNKVTGTFLTPTGDYRFLEGIVSGNKLYLSGFDGAHAYLFNADISRGNTITNGIFYSGARYKEAWTAIKNAKAKVKQDVAAMYLKPGEERLNFRFPDLDSNLVSINDSRFANKVVIVQLMGSWCPNCMDETAFLSDYYTKNKQRGIEIVALAYEYTPNFNRSVNSMRKFKTRFNVQYPMLITGVTVSDTLRTEKTLPQVTPIKVFPSSIIIDKKGKVRRFDYGFYGPGTGQHFEDYKKEFYATMDELLKEK